MMERIVFLPQTALPRSAETSDEKLYTQLQFCALPLILKKCNFIGSYSYFRFIIKLHGHHQFSFPIVRIVSKENDIGWKNSLPSTWSLQSRPNTFASSPNSLWEWRGSSWRRGEEDIFVNFMCLILTLSDDLFTFLHELSYLYLCEAS